MAEVRENKKKRELRREQETNTGEDEHEEEGAVSLEDDILASLNALGDLRIHPKLEETWHRKSRSMQGSRWQRQLWYQGH